MTFSRKNILTTIALTTTLMSCSGTVDENKSILLKGLGNGSSTTSNKYISLKSLKKTGQQEERINQLDRQVSKKYFNMEACFKSNTGRDLNGYVFNITGSEMSTVTVVADVNSCIHWQETVNIDYTQTSHNKSFSRIAEIKNTNGETKIELNFGINYLTNSFVRFDVAQNRNVEKSNKLNVENAIDMKQIRFTPKGFGKINPSNDNNIIDKPFQLYTCFNFKSNGLPMRREIIKATLINVETGREMKQSNYQLDESGCGQMSFALMHDRYSNTRRIPFSFIVHSMNPRMQGAFVERKVCLYPWSNSGWVFGHDTISGPCPSESADQNNRARIFIDEINYTFLGHDKEMAFEVNKDLDLVIHKSYVVNIFPKIHYGNLLHTMDPTEPIYSGKFRLKVAFLAPLDGDIELTANNYNKFKVISITSKIVEVEAKRIKARIDMPIKFMDIPYVHTRTYAAIRLEPIEETENSVLPATAAGTFHASSKVFRSILHTQVDINDVVTEKSTKMNELQGFLNDVFANVDDEKSGNVLKAQLERKVNKSSEVIFLEEARKNKEMEEFQTLTVEGANKQLINKLTREEISGLYNDTYNRKTIGKLCGLFFDQTEIKGWFSSSYKDYNYEKCLESPETMLSVNAFSHIEEILSKPRLEFSNTIRIYNGTGSNAQHSTTDRFGTSRRINAGVSISAKADLKVISIGAGAGLDVAKMWARDTSTGQSNRADVGQSIDLSADKLTLGFYAMTNRCVTVEGLIKYKKEMIMVLNPMSFMGNVPKQVIKEVKNTKRVRICMGAIEKEYITESWYYIGEGHQFNTILRDRLSMSENKYMVLIRGEKSMARFVDFIHTNVNSIFLKKVKKTILPDTYMKATFSDFKRMFDKNNDLMEDGAFPGTVEKYDAIGNGGDQYYGELPVQDFDPIKSPFGTKYE